VTEYTKGKATGEFDPETKLRGARPLVALCCRNPAQGPAFLEHQQGAEEEGNLAS